MRRCGFFIEVFNLELPDYLSCNQFTDSSNPEICVGHKQMREAYNRALKPGECGAWVGVCLSGPALTQPEHGVSFGFSVLGLPVRQEALHPERLALRRARRLPGPDGRVEVRVVRPGLDLLRREQVHELEARVRRRSQLPVRTGRAELQ